MTAAIPLEKLKIFWATAASIACSPLAPIRRHRIEVITVAAINSGVDRPRRQGLNFVLAEFSIGAARSGDGFYEIDFFMLTINDTCIKKGSKTKDAGQAR
jgi:hypothetical protein